jgi:hypothetical protein
MNIVALGANHNSYCNMTGARFCAVEVTIVPLLIYSSCGNHTNSRNCDDDSNQLSWYSDGLWAEWPDFESQQSKETF